MKPITQTEIDQRAFDLYDEYCHGRIGRREFLVRTAALGAAGLAVAQTMFPDDARAQTIPLADRRIKAAFVKYPSPGGLDPSAPLVLGDAPLVSASWLLTRPQGADLPQSRRQSAADRRP